MSLLTSECAVPPVGEPRDKDALARMIRSELRLQLAPLDEKLETLARLAGGAIRPKTPRVVEPLTPTQEKKSAWRKKQRHLVPPPSLHDWLQGSNATLTPEECSLPALQADTKADTKADARTSWNSSENSSESLGATGAETSWTPNELLRCHAASREVVLNGMPDRSSWTPQDHTPLRIDSSWSTSFALMPVQEDSILHQDVVATTMTTTSTPKNKLQTQASGTLMQQEANRKKQELRSEIQEFMAAKTPVTTEEQVGIVAKRARKVTSSGIFDASVASVILLNCAIIGIEVEYWEYAQDALVFLLISMFFCIFFVFEMTVRVLANGPVAYWCSFWGIFDSILVFFAVSEVLVDLGVAGGRMNVSQFRIVRMLRVARVIRFLRIPRIIRLIAPLRTLMISIMATLKSLGWALFLLVVIMYVFAIIFAQLMQDRSADMDPSNDVVRIFWSSLSVSLTTLFKSISGGISWHEASTPLRDSSAGLEFLFMIYIAFTYFAVLNVVTGVFCSSAIDAAQRDPQVIAASLNTNRTQTVDNIKELFACIDADSSGTVTADELEECLGNSDVQERLGALGLEVGDTWTLFKLMDQDNSNVIDVEEFVIGCMQLTGSASALDVAKMMYEVQKVMNKILTTVEVVEEQMDAFTVLRGGGSP